MKLNKRFQQKLKILTVLLVVLFTIEIGNAIINPKLVEASVKKASGKYEVTANNSLTVRTGSGTNYKRVGALTKGTKITVNGKKGKWYRFKYKGKNRYVHGNYLKKYTTSKKTSTSKIKVSKASGQYQVTASSLNVRTGNTAKYKRVGSLKKGKKITVNGKTSNGWYRFKYNGKNHYVSGKHLKKYTTSSKKTTTKKTNSSLVKASGKYEVTSTNLNVRTGNGTKYKKVGSIKKGTVITVNAKRGNWYRFNYKGSNRYVSGKHLKIHKPNNSTTAVVENLKTLNKSNKQVILVTTKGYNTYNAQIQTFEKNSKGKWKRVHNYKGYIGKNGFADNKREGDGKSPTGKYTIGDAFGYKGNPNTKLNFRKSTSNDVWVDDPKSKYYNTWQKKNRKGKDWNSAESMMHRLYEYGFVINYNTNQVPYKGSAIFMHTGSSYTVGCTATSQSNLISILKWIDPNKKPVIIQTPESRLGNY